MKEYTSKFLRSIVAFFLSFPLWYLLATAVLFNIRLEAYLKVFLSPLFYLILAGIVFSGFGLRELRRWSWPLVLVSQAFLAYQNAILIRYYSESHHRWFVLFIFTFFQILIVYRIKREIQVPYLFPKIRWWESNPRYRLRVPVRVSLSAQEDFDSTEILDYSVMGCFFKTRRIYQNGDRLKLQFTAFGNELLLEAAVVWVAQASVTHPQGVGAKFLFLSRSQKTSLKKATKRLARVEHYYKRYRYVLSQEDFLLGLESLEGKA